MPDFPAVAAAMTDPAWFLREDNFEPALEHELESRFTVANGFLGIRGALDIPTEASRPRTYVAGLFDLRPGPAAISALVPAPQAFPTRISVDGEELDIGRGEILEHRRLLDYRSGLLRSLWRHRLESGRVVSLESLRFAALAVPELAVQLLRLRFEEGAEVAIEAGEGDGHLLSPADEASVWQTSAGSLAVACLREFRAQEDGRPPSDWRALAGALEPLACRSELSLLQLASYGLDRDAANAAAQARQALRTGKRYALGGLYERQTALWQRRWQASDVVVDGDEEAQRALRFAVYHLNGAVDPDNSRASVGARGLTGDGYIGHVFWDTEIFMLPFYVFTWPKAARALLDYRFRTLAAARAKARRLGFRGALYAWESTDTGEEATPPYVVSPTGEVIAIRNGDLEQHVSAAVAYAVWQYWQATGDAGFLAGPGAEVLLETARFWASRCRLEGDGRYHIRHVIGPDEYHEGVDDNAYTNYMARWNLERALDVARLVQRRWPNRWRDLAGRIALTETELESWRGVAASMYVPADPVTGLIEQFSGYFGLESIDLSAFPQRPAPMDVLLGPERTRRSQVIKQADVLMLMALLPDSFSLEAQRRNFDYYEPRCGHGSSLSPPVHAVVAARLGLLDVAKRYFDETAAIDLSDSMGNSAAGLHMAALGGLWQTAVFGFGGVRLREEGLSFEPRLPVGWRSLGFPLRWRGRRLSVQISRERGSFEVSLEAGRPMTVYTAGEGRRLEKGRRLVLPLGVEEEGRV